jgi:hypothetical protein
MKRFLVFACLLAIALSAGAVLAQNGVPFDNGHGFASAAQKGQSDGQMQLALGQLQSAASDLQSSNSSAAIGALQTAVLHFQQALPIYHGNREKALHISNRAIIDLQANKPRSIDHATTRVNRAIGFTQTALSIN